MRHCSPGGTHIRVDAAVNHYLLEAPLERHQTAKVRIEDLLHKLRGHVRAFVSRGAVAPARKRGQRKDARS